MVGIGVAAIQLLVILVALLALSILGWIIVRVLRMKRASNAFAIAATIALLCAAWAYISIWGFTCLADM